MESAGRGEHDGGEKLKGEIFIRKTPVSSMPKSKIQLRIKNGKNERRGGREQEETTEGESMERQREREKNFPG